MRLSNIALVLAGLSAVLPGTLAAPIIARDHPGGIIEYDTSVMPNETLISFGNNDTNHRIDFIPPGILLPPPPGLERSRGHQNISESAVTPTISSLTLDALHSPTPEVIPSPSASIEIEYPGSPSSSPSDNLTWPVPYGTTGSGPSKSTATRPLSLTSHEPSASDTTSSVVLSEDGSSQLGASIVPSGTTSPGPNPPSITSRPTSSDSVISKTISSGKVSVTVYVTIISTAAPETTHSGVSPGANPPILPTSSTKSGTRAGNSSTSATGLSSSWTTVKVRPTTPSFAGPFRNTSSAPPLGQTSSAPVQTTSLQPTPTESRGATGVVPSAQYTSPNQSSHSGKTNSPQSSETTSVKPSSTDSICPTLPIVSVGVDQPTSKPVQTSQVTPTGRATQVTPTGRATQVTPTVSPIRQTETNLPEESRSGSTNPLYQPSPPTASVPTASGTAGRVPSTSGTLKPSSAHTAASQPSSKPTTEDTSRPGSSSDPKTQQPSRSTPSTPTNRATPTATQTPPSASKGPQPTSESQPEREHEPQRQSDEGGGADEEGGFEEEGDIADDVPARVEGVMESLRRFIRQHRGSDLLRSFKGKLGRLWNKVKNIFRSSHYAGRPGSPQAPDLPDVPDIPEVPDIDLPSPEFPPVDSLPPIPPSPEFPPVDTLPPLPSSPEFPPVDSLPPLPPSPEFPPVDTLPPLPSSPEFPSVDTLPPLPPSPEFPPVDTPPELPPSPPGSGPPSPPSGDDSPSPPSSSEPEVPEIDDPSPGAPHVGPNVPPSPPDSSPPSPKTEDSPPLPPPESERSSPPADKDPTLPPSGNVPPSPPPPPVDSLKKPPEGSEDDGNEGDDEAEDPKPNKGKGKEKFVRKCVRWEDYEQYTTYLDNAPRRPPYLHGSEKKKWKDMKKQLKHLGCVEDVAKVAFDRIKGKEVEEYDSETERIIDGLEGEAKRSNAYKKFKNYQESPGEAINAKYGWKLQDPKLRAKLREEAEEELELLENRLRKGKWTQDTSDGKPASIMDSMMRMDELRDSIKLMDRMSTYDTLPPQKSS